MVALKTKTVVGAIHCHSIVYETGTYKDIYGADSMSDVFKAAHTLADDPDYPTKYDFIACGPHVYKPQHADSSGKLKDGNFGLWEADTHKSPMVGMVARELQNNLWDWTPQQLADPDLDIDPEADWKGYFSTENRRGQFIHVNQIKSHSDTFSTYSYIVHPLYYNIFERENESVPVYKDNNTWENMLWSIQSKEPLYTNFDVMGVEIFNSFSQLAAIKGKPTPYQFEYGEWLIDELLSRGTYLHAIAGNDSFWSPDYSFDELKNNPIGSVHVWVEEFEGPASSENDEINGSGILLALRAGDFYASSGLSLHESKRAVVYNAANRTVTLNSGDSEVIWQYSMEAIARKGIKPEDSATDKVRVNGVMPKSKGETTFSLDTGWEDFYWIRFQALDPIDTRKRAWPQAIKGPLWVDAQN